MKKTAEMEKGMRTGKKLTAEILSGKWDEALKKLYMDKHDTQRKRKENLCAFSVMENGPAAICPRRCDNFAR